jgi:uncharacterized protein (DUF1778 family)
MENSKAQLRDTKVQLRMRPLQKDVIARAANLKQTTMTNFMVEHAFQAAQQILADQVHFYLSPEKWDEFCAALDAPPKELPALRKLLTELGVFDRQPARGARAARPSPARKAARSARSRPTSPDGRK